MRLIRVVDQWDIVRFYRVRIGHLTAVVGQLTLADPVRLGQAIEDQTGEAFTIHTPAWLARVSELLREAATVPMRKTDRGARKAI